MKRILPLVMFVAYGLSLNVPAVAQAQPILKRVEEMLRDQLGGLRQGETSAERGYLGLIGDDTPDGMGVVILEVYPSQPAAQAGLVAGDIITAVNGQTIRTMDELAAAAFDKPPGTKLALTVGRDGATHKIEVPLGRRPAETGPANELPVPDEAASEGTNSPAGPVASPPSGPRLGVRTVAVSPQAQLQNNLPDLAGAQVIHRAEGSPAAKAQIPLGAIITAIDTTPIKTPEELAAVIRNSNKPTVQVTYVLEGQTRRAIATLIAASDVQPPLIETQARKALGSSLPPGESGTTPATPPAPRPEPPSATSDLTKRIEALLERIEALERRIETLETKASDG